MTQTSSPWDGIVLGDAANAPYSSNEWSHLWSLLHGTGSFFPNYGVLPGTGDGTYDPLQPIASGASNVDVKVGAALVNGKLYETDAAVTLTVGANVSGNPRIDTVVLRADYVGQTIRPVILQGTPAVSPARPALTQNATTWEMPIADVAAANGFATITQADITDRRRFANTTAKGWLPYAYPIGTNPAEDYANSYSLVALSGLAVPFQITGNMLLDQLNILAFTTVNSDVDWGVYVEDVNDAGGGAGLVRRIGGRDSTSLVTFTNGAMNPVPATPPPIPLIPGAYWLIFNTSQTIAIGARSTTASRFNRSTPSFMLNTAAGALGQTINLGAGSGYSSTANEDVALAIRLEGRVFEATSAF